MTELFFAKSQLNLFVATIKNVVPCNLTGCLRLKAKNSKLHLNFLSYFRQNNIDLSTTKIAITLKNISGNGYIYITVNGIKKQYIVTNTRILNFNNTDELIITRENDCLGEVSLIFIAIKCNDNKKGEDMAVVLNNYKLFTNIKIQKTSSFDLLKQINSINQDIFLCIGNVGSGKKYDIFKNILPSYGIKLVEINHNIDSGYLYYFLNKAKYILSDKLYHNLNKKIFISNSNFKSDTPNIFSNLSFEEILDEILKDYNKNNIINKICNDIKFKIIIPSYNSEKWISKTLDSIVAQQYKNYDVCVVDDVSSDLNQKSIIKEYCDKYNSKNQNWKYIFNDTRKYSITNICEAIDNLECEDDDVIIILDGDDWLFDEFVLTKLNKVYTEEEIYLTYGQYIMYPNNEFGHVREIDKNIINEKIYRKTPWMLSHLKTFKYLLFKNIDRKDFLDFNGQPLKMTGDLALMYPMVEMSDGKIKFINDILYVYNRETPYNDDKINQQLQAEMAKFICNKQIYPTLIK